MSSDRRDDDLGPNGENVVERAGRARKSAKADERVSEPAGRGPEVAAAEPVRAKDAHARDERELDAGVNQVERVGGRRVAGAAVEQGSDLNWPKPGARPAQSPTQEALAGEARAAAPTQDAAAAAVRLHWSGSVAERFNLVQKAWGVDYEWRDQPGRVAFRDHGSALHSNVDTAAVVKGMLDLAAERGWGSVQLRGTPEFMRQAWIAAEARGIKAKGYEPSQEDQRAALIERERLTVGREDRFASAAARTTDVNRQARSQSPEVGAEALRAFDQHLSKAGLGVAAREQFLQLARQELGRMAERGKAVGVPVVDKSAEATRGSPAPSYAFKPPIKELVR